MTIKEIIISIFVFVGVIFSVQAQETVQTPEQIRNQAERFADTFSSENNIIKYKTNKTFKRTIYVDAEEGNDDNSGLLQSSAIRTLAKLELMAISGGDQILLKGGQIHKGCIELVGIPNGENEILHIGSYGLQKAIIDFSGYPAGVLVSDSSNVEISDIKITANGSPSSSEYMLRHSDSKKDFRYGIFIEPLEAKVKNILVYNVDIFDVYYFNKDDPNTPINVRPCREWSTNGESKYGWGIRALVKHKGTSIENLTIRDCHIRDVSHTGIKLNGRKGTPIRNLLIEDCSIIDTGAPGAMFSGIFDSVMRHTKIVNPGSRSDSRKWGRGSGMWLVGSDNLTFEHNYMEGSQGVADSCGAHIDIGNKNIVVQYCLSKNNAGGFIEILGKNYNCSYRYNISIDDGWRNPHDASQDAFWCWKQKETLPNGKVKEKTIGTYGCLMTVNGHTGGQFVGPFQSYIYNNTIVCGSERADGYKNNFVVEIATSVRGLLVMNNLFWIPAPFKKSKGGHYIKDGVLINNATDFRVGEIVNDGGKHRIKVRDLNDAEMAEMDIVFKNNLYKLYDPNFKNAENILPFNEDEPDSIRRYLDERPRGGNPGFVKSSGWKEAEDLIPTNPNVINRGAIIKRLKSDTTTYGVYPKLNINRDFFGNTISTPIIGASVAKVSEPENK